MRLAKNNYIYIDAQDRKKLRLPEPRLTNYTVYQYITPKGEWYVSFIWEPRRKFPPGTHYSICTSAGNRFKSLLKTKNKSIKLYFDFVVFNKKQKLIKLKGEQNNVSMVRKQPKEPNYLQCELQLHPNTLKCIRRDKGSQQDYQGQSWY